MRHRTHRIAILVAAVAVVAWAHESAWAQGTYRFERLWPVLPQPWYFASPDGIASDSANRVYIADRQHHRIIRLSSASPVNDRIQKFTSTGEFLFQWGIQGAGPGQFDFAQDLASDRDGNMYVGDAGNRQIPVFNSSGLLTHTQAHPCLRNRADWLR